MTLKRLEKLAAHLLFFMIFLETLLNVGLVCNVRVNRWELPVAYALYLGGVAVLKVRKRQRFTVRGVAIAIALPFVFVLIAQGLGRVYDSSWDGQDYHADAVIALSKGWNPWKTGRVPLPNPNGGEYVVGYPKTTWLIQASIYKATGRLNAAAITNVIAAVIAFVFVLAALRRLKLQLKWAVPIAFLAVFEIHFMQQALTLMGDGYGYELSLVAIAALLRLLMDKDKGLALALFLSSWLLLAGGKFSNLVVCAVLGAIVAIAFVRANTDKYPHLSPIILGFCVIGVLTLWVPYGRNLNNYHSPLYPQNLPAQSATLRRDNVPINLEHANRLTLLFYGIFSAPEKPSNGSPDSPQNVAILKAPFTFSKYEIAQANDYQGRVGAGGVFFGGLILLSLILYIWLLLSAALGEERRALLYIGLIITLITSTTLLIPVPNKLRYSPLLALIPLLMLISLLRSSHRGWLARAIRVAFILLIAANTIIAAGAITGARIKDIRSANRQFAALAQTHATYQVHIGSFDSSLTRLDEHHISYVRVAKLTCKNPQPLALSYDTTYLCR